MTGSEGLESSGTRGSTPVALGEKYPDIQRCIIADYDGRNPSCREVPITSNGGATHQVVPAMEALGMHYDPGARSSRLPICDEP